MSKLLLVSIVLAASMLSAATSQADAIRTAPSDAVLLFRSGEMSAAGLRVWNSQGREVFVTTPEGRLFNLPENWRRHGAWLHVELPGRRVVDVQVLLDSRDLPLPIQLPGGAPSESSALVTWFWAVLHHAYAGAVLTAGVAIAVLVWKWLHRRG